MVAEAVLWTVFSLAAPARAQTAPPPPATGLIVGRVVDAASGRPIGGAVVTLEATDAPTAVQPRALTSAGGYFVFRRLAKGSYGLTAVRSGYAGGAYGQRTPAGTSRRLQLDDGQRAGDVVVPMWKYGAIGGVVSDEAGEPLVGVQLQAFVRRYRSGRPRLVASGTALTDDRGEYRFGTLTPGDYLVAFVWHEASMPSATMDLLRNGAGTPQARDILNERLALSPMLFNAGSPGIVDTNGLLRDLANGLATPPPATNALYIYPTQFYPAAESAAKAAAITIESGQSRDGVNFSLRPAHASRVSGVVIGPDGPMPNIAVRLLPAADAALANIEASGTMTGAGGEFTLLGVPAGDYKLRIMRVPRPAPPSTTVSSMQVGTSTVMTSVGNFVAPGVPDTATLVSELPVVVADRDVTDLVVALQRGARFSGRIEFDGAAERPDSSTLTRIAIFTDEIDAGPSTGPGTSLFVPPGRPDATGAFKTYGLAPGRYLLRVGVVPGGWTLKSVTSGGRDISESPVELRSADIADVIITFTDRPTRLTGIVRGPDGNPDPAALVVVFPTDSTGWTDFGAVPRRIQRARPQPNGSYSISGLPAGDYYVAAVREEATAQWDHPDAFEQLARTAKPVHLDDGDARVQDLKSGGSR